MSSSRREFLATGFAAVAAPSIAQHAASVPWYRRTYRWGQTNITEKDPARYDVAWWRDYWKRTLVQGVIINAGGIVAYYPSKFPLHRRAEFLGDRDLYGELAAAAHQDGLAVLARMDSNRAAEEFYKAHPGWFAVDANGQPYRAADRYITCVNSPYYDEYIPAIMREIIERSHPEGLTDNSWSGLGRDSICFCENCARKFRDRTGHQLPRKADWDGEAYRAWIKWNYARRLEIWDLNNRVTKAAGGPDCLWVGMNHGSVSGQAREFRDYKEICKRAEIIMLDHQTRSDAGGFQANADCGQVIHGLLGPDKLIPESMAMYQAGRTSFRLASKPAPEARMWMFEGFAGGIQPWWHHVGAYHEDRRMYRTAEPVYRWHKANEAYLVNRQPLANVGVVWSQINTDFYGRDHAEDLTDLPYRGMVNALIRARIPYIPVHADYIERDAPALSLLILPNLAAMTDDQGEAVRRFVERGGSLLATGATSRYNEWGDARPDFGLAGVFRAHVIPQREIRDREWARASFHSFLRPAPELRVRVYGPKDGTEPAIKGERHPILRGFEETDILPFGGMLDDLKTEPGALVPLTFVPPFPVYPPETAWMREPRTNIPGLVVNEAANGHGRVVFLPADIDRRYARENLPDHANLLANAVRWAAHDSIPLRVEGRGLIDCRVYKQPGRVVMHVVNLTSAGTWRAPIDELIPVGPFEIRLRLPRGIRAGRSRLLVTNREIPVKLEGEWAIFELKSIEDHEVAVLGA